MIVFIAIFICICLYGIKVKPAEGQSFMTDYMSLPKTTAIKGIFILIVFFSHFNTYVNYSLTTDKLYLQLFSKIGQCMVTLFLFYSGYGVMESIKKKQNAYIRKMPITRVLGTLFRFDIAIVLFAVVNLMIGNRFTPKQFVLSLVAWDAVGNSNWYIFAILITYIITYIAFMLCKDKGGCYPAAVLVTLGTLAYIFVLSYFKLKASYWFDTVILYPCGIWYSLLKDKIDRIINKNLAVYLAVFVCTVAAAAYFMHSRRKSFLYTELCMIFFAAAVILFSMHVSLNNKILRFCGQHLFSLYILQRIPMMVLKHFGLADFNIYIYFIACLAVTVIMAYFFEKYTGKLWRLITEPKKEAKTEAKGY